MANSLSDFSDAIHQISEINHKKEQYARQLFAKLNLTIPYKIEIVSDHISEINELIRILTGSGRTVDNEVADRCAERLPKAIKELEDMLK